MSKPLKILREALFFLRLGLFAGLRFLAGEGAGLVNAMKLSSSFIQKKPGKAWAVATRRLPVPDRNIK